MGDFFIAVIVVHFEDTAEKGWEDKPSLRGAFCIALIVAFGEVSERRTFDKPLVREYLILLLLWSIFVLKK